MHMSSTPPLSSHQHPLTFLPLEFFLSQGISIDLNFDVEFTYQAALFNLQNGMLVYDPAYIRRKP